MKVIINADDCGLNSTVNGAIERAIQAGKITSSTIMANMDDLGGAVELYEKYHTEISFGVHLNLTEGTPILKSKELLNYGYYNEIEGNVVYNSAFVEKYRYKLLPTRIQNEIYQELTAQIKKLLTYGINISHIDSHHHIHTSLSLMRILASLSKEFNICKMRNVRNYVPGRMNYMCRKGLEILFKTQNTSYIMTDYFGIYEEYFNHSEYMNIKDNEILELMVHPGNISYEREEIMLMNMKYPASFDLINYNLL